ncbi:MULTISPECIES: hypothetical protein [Streptomyces]|uniref:Uncharacterized protein n=1 Tax=Streptomyces siderophoricus TaxID=2802281 RepID=A0ABS1MIM2_9ACTN|nr:hypothetical protein [Streptomyces sp. 9-7]MBL1087878.1 hypothetical protein [Streptomyces sp. 9-7]
MGLTISLADPPAELVEAAGGCRNEGTWPVLIGDGPEADRDPHRSPTVLSSPVALSDFPRSRRRAPATSSTAARSTTSSSSTC